MRTITSEVGNGPIYSVSATDDAVENDALDDSGLSSKWAERRPMRAQLSGAVALDNKRENCEPNPRGYVGQLGKLVCTVDNGPIADAANDNNTAARLRLVATARSYPLKETYERGELGTSLTESRKLWRSAERFKNDVAASRGELLNDGPEDVWRETLLEFFEGFFGDTIERLGPPDAGLQMGENGDFEDTDTASYGNIIDNAGWDVHRDLEPHARQLHAKQTIALVADSLGEDLHVLYAAVDKHWNAREIGETEGFKDRASASACGKGMIRSALRRLSKFYMDLDRVESNFERPTTMWPLVGSHSWWFDTYPAVRWKAVTTPIQFTACRCHESAVL